MPDGPVAAAIILVAGLTLLGLGYLLTEGRRPWGKRRTQREAVRIPLFGTDRLVARHEGDGGVDDAFADEFVAESAEQPDAHDEPGAPSAPAEERPSSHNGDGSRSNGHRASPSAGRRDPREGGTEGAPSNGIEDRPPYSPSFAPPPTLSAHDRGALRRTPASPAFSPSGGPTAAPLGPMASPSSRRPSAVPSRNAAFVDGQTLSFAIPTDGTLQFLPVRLEVVGGLDTGREVRFVRMPGEAVVEVTFGRSEGPPYRHVQLHARTVSRQHAMMSLIDHHWELRNLSTTNPVVLNGRTLTDDEVVPLLVEGDRIEMGEVVFLFHER